MLDKPGIQNINTNRFSTIKILGERISTLLLYYIFCLVTYLSLLLNEFSAILCKYFILFLSEFRCHIMFLSVYYIEVLAGH